MVEEYDQSQMSDENEEDDEESEEWLDARAELVTTEMESAISLRLARFQTVDFHDIFLAVIMMVNEKPSAA